ncbi:protein translocase subunit SecD [Candidatus Gottesmanbacteria bacterium]|nr:protein translocase subunit SecD [Candidatus Gottesmanbacteria bacterium]
MFKTPHRIFFWLLSLTVLLVFIDLPENYRIKYQILNFSIDYVLHAPRISFTVFGFRIDKDFRTQLGLDLSGGSHIALEADMKNIAESDRADALESARSVIERRINFFGVSEPTIQSSRSNTSYRILVEMPGITDVSKAESLIGQTAQLEFREFIDEKDATPGAFIFPTSGNTKPAGITGKDLRRSAVVFNSQNGAPEVGLEFNAKGAAAFSDITSRLVGKPLAIFLDSVPIMWPRINTPITDGRAVITGGFTQEEAKMLATQLNAGALPVSVSVVERRSIGATLGKESVVKSVRAGLVGLTIVAVFMVVQYGRLGVLADCALILYGLLTFAVFRLIPITLTLPGVAGFILSIGMAVDSNILIFERFKEEKRAGRPWKVAMELGFGKAWDSIRDANFTTLITCLVLFNPGNWSMLPSSGLVRGFAITLFIGVLASLFTGIVVTRTLIRVLYKEKAI